MLYAFLYSFFNPFTEIALQLFRYILDASASVRLSSASEIIPLHLEDVKRFPIDFMKVLRGQASPGSVFYSVSLPRSISVCSFTSGSPLFAPGRGRCPSCPR